VSDEISRRAALATAAAAIGAATVGLGAAADAQGAANAPPVVPEDATRLQGQPASAVGARSPFERPMRSPTGATVGGSHTPLQDLTGTITPSDLHFERHHAGIPVIDPARHRLVIHGLVERPLEFDLAELKRLPQVTRTHFIECSGNGRAAFRTPKPDLTPQQFAGQISNSEWTGVTLATLFREAGVRPNATWFLAEGGDACRLTRSVPIAKAWDDALVVWAQNGEPLRPAQGYPLRLLLPGWEGNINVKWLRRLELGTAPWMTRWETSKYTDPLPGNKARQFSFENDVKSVITAPCHPGRLAGRGWHRISGLAWTGRGRLAKVEVSTDGGANWHEADLFGATLPKSMVRFERMWEWNGESATLLSRATDETGAVQPTRTELVRARGRGTDYHFNQIVGWKVARDGGVTFHGET
jgi:sulfane dehydrogenase subunit SoxC